MIRTLTALALAAGPFVAHAAALPPAVVRVVRDVRDGWGHDRGRVRYDVLIRHRGHWDVKEMFRDREDAYRYARFLECRGFDAKVQRAGRERRNGIRQNPTGRVLNRPGRVGQTRITGGGHVTHLILGA